MPNLLQALPKIFDLKGLVRHRGLAANHGRVLGDPGFLWSSLEVCVLRVASIHRGWIGAMSPYWEQPQRDTLSEDGLLGSQIDGFGM